MVGNGPGGVQPAGLWFSSPGDWLVRGVWFETGAGAAAGADYPLFSFLLRSACGFGSVGFSFGGAACLGGSGRFGFFKSYSL